MARSAASSTTSHIWVVFFSIFIVAKAGVPVIADASKLGGEAPINPYFVSFIAILSGLFSENAIASVQAQGAKFFGTDVPGGPDRRAREDLTASLQPPDLSLKAIGAYLGTTEDVTKSILSGKMQATAEQQKTISLYLRRQLADVAHPLTFSPLCFRLCCKTRLGSIVGLRFEFWPSFGSGGIDALRAAYRDQLAIARVGGAR
jgi:hypothetical protein